MCTCHARTLMRTHTLACAFVFVLKPSRPLIKTAAELQDVCTSILSTSGLNSTCVRAGLILLSIALYITCMYLAPSLTPTRKFPLKFGIFNISSYIPEDKEDTEPRKDCGLTDHRQKIFSGSK